MTRVMFFEGQLGLDESIFRTNLLNANAPVEWYDENNREWVATGYTSAQCKASRVGLERVARIVLASWGVNDCRVYFGS